MALEKPNRGVREVMSVMELGDAAIATSGDYRHWVDVAGQSYAHTMNPAQGPRLAQERGMDALFVLREGEQFKEISIVGGQLQAQIETR